MPTFLAFLLFITCATVLVLSLQALWLGEGDDVDNPSDDAFEAHWAEVFRVYAYAFAGIGLAGVVLAVVVVWSG